MKRLIIALLALSLLIPSACKKNEAKKDEGPIAKKYAKYPLNVMKGKDLKKRLATLAKAEDVDLIAEEEYTNSKGKKITLAKIKLTDDKVGYVELRHLADRPIVFTEETNAFIRPTTGSSVHVKIPAGKIGFITSEKGNWVQIYIGKVKGKWTGAQWVNEGYSTDVKIIQEAKELEIANRLFTSDKTRKKGIEKLKEIGKGSSVIADIASDKLKELEEKKETEEKNSIKDEGEVKTDEQVPEKHMKTKDQENL